MGREMLAAAYDIGTKGPILGRFPNSSKSIRPVQFTDQQAEAIPLCAAPGRWQKPMFRFLSSPTVRRCRMQLLREVPPESPGHIVDVEYVQLISM